MSVANRSSNCLFLLLRYFSILTATDLEGTITAETRDHGRCLEVKESVEEWLCATKREAISAD